MMLRGSTTKCRVRIPVKYLPTTREGNVFTGVCLSTMGLMDMGSLIHLVMVQSVCILLEDIFLHLLLLFQSKSNYLLHVREHEI